MNATTKLYVALLLLVTLAIPGTHAEIHHSDFETIGNTPYRSADGWRFTNAEKKIPYDFSIVDENDSPIPETTCMSILSGGTVTYSGKNGFRRISLNYSSVENGDPVQFKIEISQNDAIVYEKQHYGPTTGFLSDEDRISPIAQTVTFECEEAIVGDYQLCITNNNSKTNKYVAVVFWDFTWEDAGVIATPDDDNLRWSQQPGTYRNGTAVMVNGISGSTLRLYDSDSNSLLGEVLGNNGVIPTI
ncbi:MAG: hypothetical protein K2I56_10540, partial [Muribaculaceae bacterium]|nr:hypothetical protein [Muribaculaceae bacterium]